MVTRWHDGGYSYFPLGKNKKPAVDWKRFQTTAPTSLQQDQWFNNGTVPTGLGLVTGYFGLELLGFETEAVFEQFGELVADAGLDGEWFEVTSGYLERTVNGGFHVLYRCAEVGRNLLLAGTDEPYERTSGKTSKVLIETRGNGGYVAVAPSYGRYVWLPGRGEPEFDPADLAELAPNVRDELFALARRLDQRTPPRPRSDSGGSAAGRTGRPGDDYNATVPWADVLEPAGWVALGTRPGPDGELVTDWRRPGKTDAGLSATTNIHGSDLLWVFSTSAAPFEAERSYYKFGAYAELNHDGDHAAAAKALAAEGYGGDPDDGLQEEVRRQRNRETARAMLAAEGWSIPEDRGSVAQQLADGIPEVPFVVDQLARERMNVLLLAQYKAGKSTLALNLAVAAVTGWPFLGKYAVTLPPESTVTYFNFELSQEMALSWLVDMGIHEEPGADRLYVDPMVGYRLPLPSEHVENFIVERLRRRNSSVWIVDPFSAAYPGEENSNSEVSAWTDAIDRIARLADLSLVVVAAHTGEAAAGEDGPRKARGATRLMDWLGVLWSFSHDGQGQEIPPSDYRYLRAFGRDVDVPTTTLGYDRATRTYSVRDGAPSRLQNKNEQLAVKVFDAVVNFTEKNREPMITKDLYAEFDTTHNSTKATGIKKALKLAIDKGWLKQKSGAGNSQVIEVGTEAPGVTFVPFEQD